MTLQDTPAAMVHARGLRKFYGDVEAVRGIDVEVKQGESFGFLGPNGAGKSSTMRMIAAVSPPSGGELSILGMDPQTQGPEIRSRIGVCPQEDTLDNELNVRDNLVVYGRYFGIPRREVAERADELLDFVQLTDKSKAKVEDLSGGMKRRLTIARSLINNPDVLLLDEPTTGLDPQARHVLWDRLFRLKREGGKIGVIAGLVGSSCAARRIAPCSAPALAFLPANADDPPRCRISTRVLASLVSPHKAWAFAALGALLLGSAMSLTMPVIAASIRSSVSAASNTASLSSCMSLE